MELSPFSMTTGTAPAAASAMDFGLSPDAPSLLRSPRRAAQTPAGASAWRLCDDAAPRVRRTRRSRLAVAPLASIGVSAAQPGAPSQQQPGGEEWEQGLARQQGGEHPRNDGGRALPPCLVLDAANGARRLCQRSTMNGGANVGGQEGTGESPPFLSLAAAGYHPNGRGSIHEARTAARQRRRTGSIRPPRPIGRVSDPSTRTQAPMPRLLSFLRTARRRCVKRCLPAGGQSGGRVLGACRLHLGAEVEERTGGGGRLSKHACMHASLSINQFALSCSKGSQRHPVVPAVPLLCACSAAPYRLCQQPPPSTSYCCLTAGMLTTATGHAVQ
eukprot:366311-Chlamydomonas_euryale.AAC.13